MSDPDRWSDQPHPVSDDAFAAEPSDQHGGDRPADEWLPEPSLGSETPDAPAAATGGDELSPDGSSDAGAMSTWDTESPAFGRDESTLGSREDLVPSPARDVPAEAPAWGSGTPTPDSGEAAGAPPPEDPQPEAPADPRRGGEVAATGPTAGADATSEASAADSPAPASISWGPEEPRQWGWSAEDEPAPPATAKDWSPAIPPGWPGDPPPGSWTPEPGAVSSSGEDDQGRWSGGSWAEPSSAEGGGTGEAADAPPDSDIGTAGFEADLTEAAASAAPEPVGQPAEVWASGSGADERAPAWPAADRAREPLEAVEHVASEAVEPVASEEAEPAASTEPAGVVGSATDQDVKPAAQASSPDEETESTAEAAPISGAPANEAHEAIEPAAQAAPVGGAPVDDADEVIQPAAEGASDEDGEIDSANADDTIETAVVAASVTEGEVDRVEPPGPVSDDAQVSRTGFDLIKAGRVELSQGGANRIEGGEVHITQGGAGRVYADQVSISMGGIGLAQAREVTLEADSNAFVVIANEARVQEGGRVLVLLARSVSGDVRAVLDWRSVAAVVAVLGVLRLLTRRMRGR